MKKNVRRSILFIPADRIDRIQKGISLASDAITIDLEDAILPEKKGEARLAAKRALEELDFADKEVIIRINRIGTVNGLKDLLMLYECGRVPDAIMLPKVESAGEVSLCASLVGELDSRIELLLVLESGKGLLHADEIVLSTPLITGVVFGGGDLSGEIGCSMTWENLHTARQLTLLAAAYAGVEAIDVPYLDIKDVEGLVDESNRASTMGFTGKIAIHPNQIEYINHAFQPSASELDWANKVVDTAENQDAGVLCVDGRMVDEAVLKRARRIVAVAGLLSIKNGR